MRKPLFASSVAGALAAIEANRSRIDDLNVYPVPDGDTGTNLTLTVRAVAEALAADGPDDRAGLAREVARAALMGARGNSGVILSQIVRGAADALADGDDLARIFRSASDAAYRAVKKPVEGTMLTAIAAWPTPPSTTATSTDVRSPRGDDTVTQTRDMLPVLREAGVVDAGAAGLVEIVRGIAAALEGKPLPAAPAHERELAVEAIHQELSRYRYCTVFVVEGDGLDADGLEAELEQLGDSLLVVGDPTALKVHVHTDDPGRALSLGVARGIVGGVEIANMHEQTQHREERLLHPVATAEQVCDVIAVAVGEGNRQLIESFGAAVVDGGSTMNPSTADLVAAIEASQAAEVVVLPNNPNVLMSAEQAAEHAAKPTRVVPTRSLQAGLAALVAFDPGLDAGANAEAMGEAAAAVATGAVTVASRDVALDGLSVRKGEWLGLAGEQAVAGGTAFDDVARAVLERLLEEPRGILTLLTGDEPPPLRGLLSELESGHPELEVEVHQGGQPHYPLLLSAETTDQPARVVLVEDSDSFREMLEMVFEPVAELTVVGSAAGGDEAVALCARLEPDVVLVDYRMPGMNGAETTRAILAASPGTRVICLTASIAADEIDELMTAGAVACITKDEEPGRDRRPRSTRRPGGCPREPHRRSPPPPPRALSTVPESFRGCGWRDPLVVRQLS